jgi:hypothetical protein
MITYYCREPSCYRTVARPDASRFNLRPTCMGFGWTHGPMLTRLGRMRLTPTRICAACERIIVPGTPYRSSGPLSGRAPSYHAKCAP